SPDRPIGGHDLERVAGDGDRVEVDPLQHRAAEDLEAAGEVVDPDAEDPTGVGAAAAADRPPQRAPLRHRTALDVARSEDQVAAFEGREQPRKVGWVV